MGRKAKHLKMEYNEEIKKLLTSKPLSASDMQKLTTLVALMSEGEGDNAYDETMYGYLIGVHDWRKDYREFIA